MRGRDRENLTEYIELHERSWGMEKYPGKPKLDAILKSPVVVFWRSTDSKEERWLVTLHADLKELEKYFSRLIIRSVLELPDKRVAKIFKDGKQVVVRGVKIEFQEPESP